jgi:hypothetical protein
MVSKINEAGMHLFRYLAGSAAVILLCCFLLFYMDKDTKSFAQLFTRQNLAALLIYFFPTWMICYFFYRFFRKRQNKDSFALALGLGIPVSFTVVIITLLILMNRI